MTHYKKTKGGILVPFAPHIAKRNYIDGEVSNNATMEGLYQLTLRRADGSVKRQTPWFKNLILDTGLNRYGSGSICDVGSGGGCEIGTGTAPPLATQTSLQNFSARTSSLSAGPSKTALGAAPYYMATTATFRFNTGTLNGNYTEVGIGWASNNLFSRALITPDGVNPEAFPVQSDESLDVSYQVRVYAPSAGDWGAGTYTISGASYDIFGRVANSANSPGGAAHALNGLMLPFDSSGLSPYSGPVGAVTSSPSGSLGTSSTGAAAAYSNNSLLRQQTATFGLTAGNVAGGIRSIYCQNATGTAYNIQTQYQFTPAIPKDSTKTLTLTFQLTWGRRP